MAIFSDEAWCDEDSEFMKEYREKYESGVHIEDVSPINLEYRKKVSEKKDKYTLKYLDEFADDMKYRFDTPIINMSNDDLIMFAVKFLSNCEDYYYYYIKDEKKIIGEIYSYECEDNEYYFNIYMEEKYRTDENYNRVLFCFEHKMFSPLNNIKKIVWSTKNKSIIKFLNNSNFELDTEFSSGENRYVLEDYTYNGMKLITPSLEYEEKYLKYLKNNKKNIKHFNYKKFLKRINRKNGKTYFLTYDNDYLKEDEIVGIGYVDNNWEKINCIKYEIDKSRRDTKFGEYCLRMLLKKLNEDAEYIILIADKKDKYKNKEIKNYFEKTQPIIKKIGNKVIYVITLIVY